MNDLPLQVTEIDDVEVDEADGPDAGGREIHCRRRSKPSCADAEHLAGFQTPLTVNAHFGHDQMPAVPFDLIVRQLGQIQDLDFSGTSGDRGNDADGVARPYLRLLLLQIADVFVVQVDVDEASKL